MIIDFGDRTTEDIFHGFDSKQARRIPSSIWAVALRKLDMINAAYELKDLKVPPANRLERLKGRWAGLYSIRIDSQYRVVFKWADHNAKDVLITDYH